MCTILEADHILAIIFKAGSDTVSIDQLKTLRRKIEGSCTGLFLDIDTDSLMYAVEKWSDYFEWHDDGSDCFIKRRKMITSDDMKTNWYKEIPKPFAEVLQ
ncbi:MAG: hypothetical protein ACYC1M_10550 [Armatimonadota bacterium]